MFKNFKNKTTLACVLILFAAIVVSFSVFKYTKGAGLLPFGGRVVTTFPCPCSGNFLLTVSAPSGGQFVYYPGTQAYLNYNLPATGVWALGLYSPGGICLIPVIHGCIPVGVPVGTISPTVGTSLAF